jgi:hypothetical protein
MRQIQQQLKDTASAIPRQHMANALLGSSTLADAEMGPVCSMTPINTAGGLFHFLTTWHQTPARLTLMLTMSSAVACCAVQGPTFTGSIIPNLQTISTLDQYSDQLPYLLTTLPSQDAACSSHQCCHLQQPGHKGQQQQGQGQGWCPLQGLPSKLLVSNAQLNPLVSLAQQQQQQEGRDEKAATDKGGKQTGKTTTRGLLQLQQGLVYGPQDVQLGVIPTHAISRAAAEGVAGIWPALDGVSRRLSGQAGQNNTKKASGVTNATAASSSTGTAKPPTSSSSSSSSDDSSSEPVAATDPPTESAQSDAGISEAMAILQWPRPPTTAAAAAATAGGRDGSASRVAALKQRMQQQGPAGQAAAAAASVDFQLPADLSEEDVAYMTLTQLSGLLRSGQVTPQQLVALYEARITR